MLRPRTPAGGYKLPVEPERTGVRNALGIGLFFFASMLLALVVVTALLWAADRKQAEFEAERWERLQLEAPE